ncbi:probable 28S rRNA (cytosine-C(5))-methyltransferase [Odontomachus brunneus]|uniref:probable 28S rRNA (cytosine-C(5))-methyltransferase n=1 Tax=Odontomachus brunneus TaxID=486640 RepID=UPI0013F1A71D|nr:probable 28S rRNA (cytosine-C(5))-methyltransferase [Odontomachus brunneus]
MSDGFVHSVKVPRIYKITADIVRCVQERGASLKTLIYEKKHPNVSGIYALSVNTLQAGAQLDLLLQRTQILTEQPRLDPWLTRVLITELLWGKKHLQSLSKPIQTILSYADLLQNELKNLENTRSSATSKKVLRPRYMRVNTLLLSVEQAISLFEEEGWKLLSKSATYSSYLHSLSLLSKPYFLQDFHVPEVLAFPPATSFYDHAGYRNGKLILQDKASCLPAHLLNPNEGSEVLDLCAAPGMKTTHLAAKLQNNGTIYAVEIDKRRFGILREQVEATHSFCVELINQDALTLTAKQYRRVRYILVDPSCSGSGIVDRPKQSDVDGDVEPKRLQNLQSIQVYLLRYALLNFPKVERVVYSTCSVHPEENEQVIDEVLSNIGDAYRLVPIKNILQENWLNFSSPEYNCGDKCLYSRPDVDLCNGFFVAIFERNFAVPLPTCKRKGGNVNFEQSDLSTKEDNMMEDNEKGTEKVSKSKKKKRGKKKNKGANSTIHEQTGKALEHAGEFEKSEEVKDERIDVCLKSKDGKDSNNEEIIPNRLEETPQNTKSKKSGKKRKLKSQDASSVEDSTTNKETMKICEEVEQDKEVKERKLKKKKKKKKKKSKAVVEINDDVEKPKEDEQIETEPVKKKRKTEKKNKEIIEIDTEEKI